MDIRKLLVIINENQQPVKPLFEAMGMKVTPLSDFFAPKASKKSDKDNSEEVDEGDKSNKWYTKFLEVANKEEEDENPEPEINEPVNPEEPIKPEKLKGVIARVTKPGEVENWTTMRALTKVFKENPKLKKEFPKVYNEVIRITQTKGMPYLHPNLVPLVDKILSTHPSSDDDAEPKTTTSDGKSDFKGILLQGKKVDLVEFFKNMTARPDNILKQNAKMKHSDGTTSIYFNIGIPAIKGLVGDEEVGPPDVNAPDGGASSFLFINTCPGAGACKLVCYVGKGGYVQFQDSNLGMTRKLNFLYNDPRGFMNKLGNEISQLERTKGKKGTKIVIRWHDAGDFFSPEYAKLAFELTKKHPNVLFYAYTKIKNLALGETPDNFVMNYSFGGKDDKSMDRKTLKHSDVVPKEMYLDYVSRVPKPGAKPNKKGKIPTMVIYKDADSINELKQKIADKFNIDPKTLLTYDEFVKIPPSDEKNKWNVIVKPGDGDTAAARRDVLGSYLLEH